MFVFLDQTVKIQATSYIKIRSTSSAAVTNRHNSEKESFAIEKFISSEVC